MTRPYAEVIGDPIAHSKSPLIHNFWLGKLGIDAEYRPCHVRPGELANYFARRCEDAEWRGCNVTIPHKLSVLEFADEREPGAEDVGAANCVVPRNGRLIAHNTDVDGVASAILDAHSSVCIIGAGGAARAAFPGLNMHCVEDIRILARNPDKAAVSLADLGNDIHVFAMEDAAAALRDVDGVINASPLGMTGQPPMPNPVIDSLVLTKPDSYVFDMVYAPLETELLKAARAYDRDAIDGLTMLVGQARSAFEKFFGQPAPRQHDTELRSLLTA